MGCKSCLQVCRSNPCSFRDTTFIVIFQKKIRKLNEFFSSEFEIRYPVLCAVRVLSGVANLASEYDGSNFCSFRDMMVFRFLPNVFRKLGFEIIQKDLKTFGKNLKNHHILSPTRI